MDDLTCIILAGGEGTRLRSVVADVPKAMAPIKGIPFLEILLNHLNRGGVQNFILATGYKSGAIQNYFLEKKMPSSIRYSIEKEPLGTGGAILQALSQVSTSKVLVVNGDTFFGLNMNQFIKKAMQIDKTCVLALKEIENTDRYGSVQVSENRITRFVEKKWKKRALINTGIYLLDREEFLTLSLPKKFSFEKEFLEKFAPKGKVYGVKEEGYFIDIGVPKDYQKAQKTLAFNE